MAAAAAQDVTDGIAPSDAINSSFSKLTVDAEEVPANTEKLKEQPSTEDEGVIPEDIVEDTKSNDPPSSDVAGVVGSLDAGPGQNNGDPPNVHVPQPQPIYLGGYTSAASEWDDYPQYLHPDFLELGSPGIYSENQSLMFPTGYGYNVQMPFGPYSPVTPPPPSARGGSQMYTTQHLPYTGPYFQQSIPPNLPYLNSPRPLSQADLAMPLAMEQQGAYISDTSNSSGMHFGQRPNYPSYGAFGRSTFAGNSGFYDSRQVFDGFGSSGLWSNWSKSPDGQRSLAPLSPAPLIGTFGHSSSPFTSGQASQQQRPLFGFGSSIGSYDRGYPHGGVYHQSNSYGAGLGNGRSWARLDKARWPGKDNASLCSCNGTLDFLGEQNRGPRSTRPKNSTMEENLSTDSKNSNSSTVVDRKLYNKPDFITDYVDAKFFIIKSYSEDNIHKSIKYGVWTSTPNGNKKLDAAYQEAKEKEDACPVFLFFSVNASAQFCGVAEMAGPVDFEKSVDYWQQDKWCGQFPVKWHIVKDVPNNLLRHIILENNDNKPVTNSRDTQEVKLEQGLEMLNIFKKHESDMSILDDFDFYEERQKAMQERKAWRQQHQSNSTAYPLSSGVEQHRPAPLSVNFVNQMPKSFAQVVRLDESTKENSIAVEMDRPGPGELPNSAAAAAVQGS